MNTPLRARYVGYVSGTENHGDEALMWTIAQLLAPDIEVIFQDEDDYDIAFLGGGTLINQSPWLIEHFGGLLARAPLGGFVFGSGVGDVAFWGDHLAEWKRLLDQCDLVGVRGPRSLRMLHEAGVKHAEQIGDPYLALRPPMLSAQKQQLLAVNCGSTNDALWGGDDRAYIDFLLETLQRLHTRGWHFLFLSVWSKDLPIVTELRDRLGVTDAPVLDARANSLEVLARLSSCEAFVGEKLHACAMAAVAEVPFVSLEYQPKIRDFAESLRMDAYTMSTAQRDPDGLVRLIEEVAANRDILRTRLQELLADHRARLKDFSRRVQRHFVLRRATSSEFP